MTDVKSPAKIGAVPNQPKTPMRSLRVTDELWDRVKAEADERGLTWSDIVREALIEHFERRDS